MNSNPRGGVRPLSGSRTHLPGAIPLVAILMLTGLVVSACGQRGPLFLPDERTAAPAAVEVEQEHVENSPKPQDEEDDDEEMPGT
jgi:predicted small lipoprotein YifL